MSADQLIYSVSQTAGLYAVAHYLLTDFHNSFTSRLSSDRVRN